MPANGQRTALRGPKGLWDAMAAATAPSPSPAQMRAVAFAASLGPAGTPKPVDDGIEVVDVAADEAVLAYLERAATKVASPATPLDHIDLAPYRW